ncbi:ribosome biogenesis GTP-binding protein YihA/YsxC [Thalassotalea psychrophila]|uniref:Probable GTP-binding protein EngB n=1 Tax=Thalassotalea psychrophila TaxID=3065647 RepID=A0ABY9TXE2_9GAMM|nr:ribosome biogenesis GTP-binding protein YihA/YsxC [Colwelliaceae bacterium SQ149]
MVDPVLTTPLVNLHVAKFELSAPDIRRLPADSGIEVAFAGRSNAGKSSALNTLTNQKALARTSKTPGRTQLINVFDIRENRRLIDLPGYGFAKVPLEMKKKWQKALAEYLEKRMSLKGLVLLMDIRHPLKDLDVDLINWANDSQLPTLVLLTKADKLKPGKRNSEVLQVRKKCLTMHDNIKVQAFSSLTKVGLEQATAAISDWFINIEHQELVDIADEEEFDESE